MTARHGAASASPAASLSAAVSTPPGDDGDRSWSVGQVARLAGVSVRTLHHYDDIGLVAPSERTAAGYRAYRAEDLERLRAVLVWRELEFSLEEIRELIEADTDPRTALLGQRRQLTIQIDRLHRIVAAIDRELEAHTMDLDLTPEEKLEVFGDFDPDEHAAEAQERWGDTDAWKQSQRRASQYTKEDWKTMSAELAAIEQEFIALVDDGVAPESEAAMDVAERHRDHITRWFYDCSVEMHEGLGQMYVQDPRFTAHYDDQREGLAAFVSDAFTANALRQVEADGAGHGHS